MERKALDFQKEGVRFLITAPPELNHKPHRLLADEMGLGKTVQVCLAARVIKAQSGLIFCPWSLKQMWARQMVDWGVCQPEDIFIVNTGKDIIPDTAKFVIVNYELVESKNICDQLRSRRYAFGVCDEVQRIKALKGKRSRTIIGGKDPILSRCWYKWFLTGTFMPNRPIDCFPLLSSMAPETIQPYTTLAGYAKKFCDGVVDRFDNIIDMRGASALRELRERLQPFMLRREVKDVYQQLPEVVHTDVYLDCGQIAEEESNTPIATLNRLVGLQKLPFAIRFVEDILVDVDKVLLFAYHRDVVEGLTAGLPDAVKIYGGMSREQRQTSIDSFTKGDARVLVAQISSSGEGIDGLQYICNTVIFVEVDWSAGLMDQALARLKRIGQANIVNAFTLIAEGTLDDAKVGLYWKKKRWISTLNYKEKPMIEQELKRIADALEKLISSGGLYNPPASPEVETKTTKGKGGAKGADKPTPPAQEKSAEPDAAPEPVKESSGGKKVSLDDVRNAARELLAAHKGSDEGRAAIRRIVEANGADSLPNIAQDKWEKALSEFKAATADAGLGV